MMTKISGIIFQGHWATVVLGIKPLQVHPVAVRSGCKRNVVRLFHLVGKGHIKFVVYNFGFGSMSFIGCARFKR